MVKFTKVKKNKSLSMSKSKSKGFNPHGRKHATMHTAFKG
jgi:hypothetical protein